jgi:hypothetical protein
MSPDTCRAGECVKAPVGIVSTLAVRIDRHEPSGRDARRGTEAVSSNIKKMSCELDVSFCQDIVTVT